MVRVTRDLADRIAEVARLLKDGEAEPAVLHRVTALGAELVPGAAGAAVTIAGSRPLTFAVSGPRVGQLHELQFSAGEGPAVETLRHNEPRRIDDTATEPRWPRFCQAAQERGFASCLMLPLRTDQQPAGTVSFYAARPRTFIGTVHDIATLFAAQGGSAVVNAAVFRECREMIDNLHTALESRALIEQAKGILEAKLGVTPEQAFRLLNRMSQNSNRKVRLIAADLIAGRLRSDQFHAAGNR
jgi:GAF domain-containing protein